MGQTFLREAICLSFENVRMNNGGPFGAVVVKDGTITARGTSVVTQTNDPPAHAEVVAIRAACIHLRTFDLTGCDLYVNCEPCPMCLAAVYWSRLRSITYAATRDDAAAIGFQDAFVYEQMALPASLDQPNAPRQPPPALVTRERPDNALDLGLVMSASLRRAPAVSTSRPVCSERLHPSLGLDIEFRSRSSSGRS